MEIRPERAGDEGVIAEVIGEAFAIAEHSDGTEAAIVDRLRQAGALRISLVAVVDGEVAGHVAFSPVTIDGEHCRWFGLGPVAVMPGRQQSGVGVALIRKGLEQLQEQGADGCVVVGEPAYYGRFGFAADPRLTCTGLPPLFFQALAFSGDMPAGTVAYHPAFG